MNPRFDELPVLVRLFREIQGEPFNKMKNSEVIAAMTDTNFVVQNLASIVAKRRGIQVVYTSD